MIHGFNKDDDQFADSTDWPGGGVDGPFDDKTPSGKETVAEALALASTHSQSAVSSWDYRA